MAKIGFEFDCVLKNASHVSKVPSKIYKLRNKGRGYSVLL